MKAMKKISTLFLALCLMVSCMSLTVFAADGRISFSDPSTAVGDDVEITCAVRSEGNNMNTVEVDIDYDTEYLKFKSGEGATEGESGALILSSDQGGTDVVFTLTFQALKEGDTKVTIESYRITGENGDSMDFTMGNSSVKVAEGDPSKIDNSDDTTTGTASGSTSTNTKTATVEINGVQYTLTGDFPDAMIPSGYVRADVSLGGEELPMLQSETSGAVLAYLVDSSGTGDFFYYDPDSEEVWWPYAEVEISDSTTLLLLSDTSKVSLPEVYKEATLTIDNKEFPTWQDTSNDQGYYIIYGLASDGDKGYYRYDSKQGTYQRFDVSAEEDTEEEAVPAGILGQIEQFVKDHLPLCIIAAGVILVLLLILLLVLAVKLHNRNRELDELYDEYGIDEEPEPEPTPSKKEQKKAQKKAKKAKQEEAFEEDYAEDLYGDGEDFADDEYTEEILGEDDLDEDDLEDEDFFDEEYDSDEDPLDLSQNLTEATGKLTIVEDEDDFEEDEEEPVDDKTRALNSKDEVKAARKAAAAKTGKPAQKKSAQAKSSQAKSAQAKSGKVRRTSTEQSGQSAAQPKKKASVKKTATQKTSSRTVDEDLENVPEDEDIFAGYDKREELTLDDLYGEEKKKKKKGHQEDDDSFKVDFIDLD